MARRDRRSTPPPSPLPTDGRVEGRISIVQEDRFRLMDDDGRGYLFVTRKRAASMTQLEAWRDHGTPVVVDFHGVPDLGAIARRVRPVS